MRGLELEPFSYILECERDMPEETRTTWWILPKTGREANRSARLYAAAKRTVRSGYDEYNEKKLNVADREEFSSIVIKAENYCYSTRWIGHKNHLGEEYRGEDDYYWKEITDREMIGNIAHDIPGWALNEIIEQASTVSTVTPSEEKKYRARHAVRDVDRGSGNGDN